MSYVFLTGATGLLGGVVAGALRDAGHDITALVRDKTAVTDMEGRNRANEMHLVRGDVAQPDFGLDKPPQDIDLLVHCAAITDFSAPAALYERVNIGGAAHAVALAKELDCPLLHVSTAYVCGRQDGAIAEGRAGPAQYTNGYEASKAAVERLVMEAVDAGEINAAIARPSIIVGRMRDGQIPVMDSFYHLFRMMGEGHLGALPALPHAAFNMVPIDHVVSGIVTMAENMAAYSGRAVHLTAPKPVTLASLLDVIGEYPGTDTPRLVAPDVFDRSLLDRRQGLIHRRIAPLYYEYFQRAPDFETSVLQDVSGISCPHVDRNALYRMIDYCVQSGFVKWQIRDAALAV